MLSRRVLVLVGTLSFVAAATEVRGDDGRPAGARVAASDQPSAATSLGNAWSDPRNPIVRIFGGERLDLWSLQRVRRPEPPAVQRSAWLRNPIDRFVLARLEDAKLSPTAEADRRVLVRRIYFDLLGLPPTPADVARFLADERPDAYERLVDALLASPRYGEHIARMWLDVVRYSDSNGFDWDEFRPTAWRYRDYVIRSFNADKPYDAFLREQLAGDELLAGPPRTRAEQDMLLATGFLRIGPQDNSASLFNEQDRARAEWMFDVVEASTSAFLGLTFSCCRCHDHKFDPLSQADYYRLKAFFEPLRYADDMPLDLAEERGVIESHNAAVEAEIASLEEERADLRATAKRRLQEPKTAALSSREQELLNVPEGERTAEQRATVEQIEKRIAVADEEVSEALREDERERDRQLASEIEAQRRRRRTHLHGLIATDSAEAPQDTFILVHGNHREAGKAVEPGIPSILDPIAADVCQPPNPRTHGRRLTLANWIASPNNPLTARVVVNRVWQMHFGRGLVATPNDFGLAGARPTHPDLLDWLAAEFMEGGWSIKRLQRLIVTSATYRQAAASTSSVAPGASAASIPPDAQNVLLSGREMRRLTAEQLRDALLAVSGLLTAKDGGAPIWPELPQDILQANPALLDDNAEKTKGWYPSPPAEQFARSIFLVQKRGVQVPFLATFDLPDNSVSCPQRTVSTVAPQALSLLNSPLAFEAAQGLARRIRTTASDESAAQTEQAFSLALQRRPAPAELDRCVDFLRSHSLEELCRVILNLNEFAFVE